jgi:N-acetylmuramoyl-L-alanine amidase
MHGCQRRDAARKAAPIVLMAFLAAAAQVGCVRVTIDEPAPPRVTAKRDAVGDLASRLGLAIVESSPTRATLQRGANTVMLFSDPGGRAYVNGKPVNVPDGGRILAGKTSMHFPPALIDAIGSALPKDPPKPPKPVTQTHKKKTGPPNPRPIKLGRVLIDAGHGGDDTGTDAAFRLYGIRLYEKDVNLPVAQAVAKMLKLRGAEGHMTRTRDRTVSLDDRVSVANRLRPKLFVSIHANSMAQTSMRGFLLLRPAVASADSLDAAAIVERHLVRIGLSGEVRKDVRALRVLRKTTCPAILIEMGYLSNRYDARMLADPHWRTKIATAIADAVTEYLKKRAGRPRR